MYQGLPGEALQITTNIEKGYRDMVTPYNGYLLSFAATSLVVQSAYESLQNVDLNQWKLLQSEYTSKIHNSIKRMQEMDQLMQD